MFKKPSLPIPDCFLLKMRPSTDGGKDFLRRGMIAQRVLFDATSYFLRAAPWREERSSHPAVSTQELYQFQAGDCRQLLALPHLDSDRNRPQILPSKHLVIDHRTSEALADRGNVW